MHFLTAEEARGERAVGKPYACVVVKVSRITHRGVRRRSLTVCTDRGVSVFRADALVVPLPESVGVVLEDGDVLRPSRTFWVTTETFDPYHLLTDMDP